jgi:hypothetical protein
VADEEIVVRATFDDDATARMAAFRAQIARFDEDANRAQLNRIRLARQIAQGDRLMETQTRRAARALSDFDAAADRAQRSSSRWRRVWTDSGGLDGILRRSGGALSAFGQRLGSVGSSIARHATHVAGLTLKYGALALAIAAAGTAVAGGALLAWGSKLGSDITANKVMFQNLFKNREDGSVVSAQIYQDLQKFALKSPFDTNEVMQGAASLYAAGIPAERLLATLDLIGDTSAALGKEKFPYISKAIAQMSTKQRLMTQEMNQLTEQGVPAWELLSEVVSKAEGKLVTVAEIQGRMSKGARDGKPGGGAELFKHYDAFLASMGGRFGGAQNALLGTFRGQMGLLKDVIHQGVGKIMEPINEGVFRPILEKNIPKLERALGRLATKSNRFVMGYRLAEAYGKSGLRGGINMALGPGAAKGYDAVRLKIREIGNAYKQYVRPAVNAIGRMGGQLARALANFKLPAGTKSFFANLGTSLSSGLTKAMPHLQRMWRIVKGGLRELGPMFASLARLARTLAPAFIVAGYIMAWAFRLVIPLVTAAATTINSILSFLGNIPGKVSSAKASMVSGFNAMKAPIDAVIAKVRELVGWLGSIKVPSLSGLGSGIAGRFSSAIPKGDTRGPRLSVTSGIRDHSLGSRRSAHPQGRAVDLVGGGLSSMASAVNRSGGYAAFHGRNEGRHLHVETPQPMFGDAAPRFGGMDGGGGATYQISVTVNSPSSNVDVSAAVRSALRDVERQRRERS